RVPIGAENLQPGVGVPLRERMLAGVLRDRGYTTAHVGKWHLGGTAPISPRPLRVRRVLRLHAGRPLLRVASLEGSHDLVAPHRSPKRRESPMDIEGRQRYLEHLGRNEPDYNADNPLLRDSQSVDETEHLTEAFTREAIDFVQR